MSQEEQRICRVGYALNQKKLGKSDSTTRLNSWKGGGLIDIINASDIKGEPIDGVLFYPFDLESDIKYDVIIHKLTDDIERSEPSDKLRDLLTYISLNQNVVLVDPLQSVSLVTSRRRSCECIRDVEGPLIRDNFESASSYQFVQPKHFIVESKMSHDIFMEQMQAHQGCQSNL